MEVCGEALEDLWHCTNLLRNLPRSHPKSTAPSKSTAGRLNSLSSPMIGWWVRRERESRCINNPQKPLFSCLGIPNGSASAYKSWNQNLCCGWELLKCSLPIVAGEGNCQRAELQSWKSKLRTSLWAAARPAGTSQALSSLRNCLTWAAPSIQILCTTLSKQITKYQAAPQRR